MRQLRQLKQQLHHYQNDPSQKEMVQTTYSHYLNRLAKLQRDTGNYFKDQWWISDEDEELMAEAAQFPSQFEGISSSSQQLSQLRSANQDAANSVRQNVTNQYQDEIGNGADFLAGVSDGVFMGQGELISNILYNEDSQWASEDSRWYRGGKIAGQIATGGKTAGAKTGAKGLGNLRVLNPNGPSGKIKRFNINHPTRKRALDAARNEGRKAPDLDRPKNIGEKPHYHSRNNEYKGKGKRKEKKGDRGRAHHSYPKQK